MVSLVTRGMLVYVLGSLLPTTYRMRVARIDAAVLLVLAIGFSPPYLGAHAFRDVVACFAAGLV